MKLSEVKLALENLQIVNFQLPSGELVPAHFHVTEVGETIKHFIDCGGNVRHEKVANFQLWEANDYAHRLKPDKLKNIISLSERTLGLGDLEVEVEYQSTTIGKYDLDFDGQNFVLVNKFTNCLAQDKCGIPQEKLKVRLADISLDKAVSSCKPGSGCC